jgi:tetratricopeptide (TPR) repeat protein
MEKSTEQNRGLELAREGRLEEAEAIFQRVLKSDPNDPESLYFFGVLAARRSDPEQAESFLKRAIDVRPDWAKAWNNLGAALNAQGKLEEALVACSEAVRFDPEAAENQYNYGLALHASGHLQDALEALQIATTTNPGFADAFSNMGAVLKDLSRHTESESAYRRAAEISPNHAEAHSNLSMALRRLRRYEEAVIESERAIELKPDIAAFYSNRANLLRVRGQITEAEQACRRSIELDPAHTEAYLILAGLKLIEKGDPVMASMLSLAQSSSLTLAHQVNIHFALAKALESQQDFDTAFDHFNAANRLRRSIINYDDGDRESTVRRIMSVFDRELLQRAVDSGNESDAPIFILGMPRSGTTLVEQILASHSEVEAGGELDTLYQIATSTGYPEAFSQMPLEELRSIGASYILNCGFSATRHFTDKMPENFLYIGLIKLILPRAKIIHCRRTPADTCLSCYSQKFGSGNLLYSYDLQELGLEYRRYQRIMAHWEKVMPGTTYNLDYEDLINDQEGETRRMLDYCGLPFEEACLQFSKTKRIVDTASASQVRKGLYSTSVGRWKQYEKYLEPLLAVLDE